MLIILQVSEWGHDFRCMDAAVRLPPDLGQGALGSISSHWRLTSTCPLAPPPPAWPDSPQCPSLAAGPPTCSCPPSSRSSPPCPWWLSRCGPHQWLACPGPATSMPPDLISPMLVHARTQPPRLRTGQRHAKGAGRHHLGAAAQAAAFDQGLLQPAQHRLPGGRVDWAMRRALV